jgi:cellulose synthase/poly-beta-1,6-N-acetylglucosamine synthase-like glycosyltransferase
VTDPIVSVVMSVYNGAKDLPNAVRCVLDQTFTDFEFIAIDDASPDDNSADLLEELAQHYGDARFHVVRLPSNRGLAGALNHGLELARGRYIARQDQDDVSDPTRLAKQVAFMEANPKCGLLGTRAQIWVGDTPTQRTHDHPIDNATLQLDLMFNNPFVHSSVMMRRSALNVVGGYTTDRSRQPPEDYELWSRISRRYLVANLPERLLIYRETPNSMSRVGPNPFLDKLVLITSENIAYHAGLDGPDQRCRDAGALAHAAYHKVSPEADIEGVCGIVSTAVDRLVAQTGEKHLLQRAEAAVTTLRYQFSRISRPPASPAALTSPLWQLAALSLTARLRKWINKTPPGD